jgi:uncharacterized cupin superfamily protein
MANLNEPVFEDRGMEGFRVRRARLAQAAGAKQIGMSLWEIPPGGHQLRNRGPSSARFLSISSSPAEGDDVVVYPDSAKIGVFAQNRFELFPLDSAVDFWEGEKPPS